MFENILRKFDEMGAEAQVSTSSRVETLTIDIATIKNKEVFDITVNPDIDGSLDLQVLQVLPRDRHLVLLARHLNAADRVEDKFHYLCGHDERHWFVASVSGVSTVADAKASLKPWEIIGSERRARLRQRMRNRRKNEVFVRQGEWFFVPAQGIKIPAAFVLRSEPMRRSSARASKPHWAEFAYRFGGEQVMVCDQYPNGVTMAQYTRLLERRPTTAKLNWAERRRNAAMFVKGRITHPDHATIVLADWHRVLMNTESESARETVAFID